MALRVLIFSILLSCLTFLTSAQSHPFLVEFFDESDCSGELVQSEYLGFQDINRFHNTKSSYLSIRTTEIAKDVFRKHLAIRMRPFDFANRNMGDADFHDAELLEDEKRNCTTYHGASFEVVSLKEPSTPPKESKTGRR